MQRLSRLESRSETDDREIHAIRERVHDLANLVTALGGRVRVGEDSIAAVLTTLAGVGELKGGFESHTKFCTDARKEDIEHRNIYEEGVGKRFDKIDAHLATARKRQFVTMTMIGTGMLTVIWWLLQTYVIGKGVL